MNRLTRSILPGVAALVLFASTAAIASTRVSVPDGTPVTFRLVSAVNTEDNHVGDVIDMQTVGDVVVDSWVVIPDASKGQCQVSRVEQAGGHGHAGSIEITCSYVVSADHGRVKLTDAVFTEEGEKQHGMATVAGIFTYGIASNAVKGSEASINTTRTMTAHVDGNVHITAALKAHGDLGTFDK